MLLKNTQYQSKVLQDMTKVTSLVIVGDVL